MSADNQSWYNLNSTRAYPVDDRATRESDAGPPLPHGLLLDCAIQFPREIGNYLFLSAVSVSRNLWTAVFSACDGIDAGAGFVPAAALYLGPEWRPESSYGVRPLHPGVSGRIAIGGDKAEAYRGRFSTPAQSLLLPRVARPYSGFGVQSLGKLDLRSALTGLVRFRSGNDIEVVGADREIEGRERRVVVFRLKEPTGARNPLEAYAGPCGGRPESGTCATPAIEFLNEVGPDCNGNIQLVFPDAVDVVPYLGGGGLDINHPLGLDRACTNKKRLPDSQGRLPGDSDDTCTPLYEGYESSGGPYPETAPPADGIPGSSAGPFDGPPLPYTEDFDDGVADGWKVLAGEFGLAPGDSYESSGSSAAGAQAYGTLDGFVRSVAVLDNHSYWTTTAKVVSTELRVNAGGSLGSGGLVLNYRTALRTVPADEYIAAEVDVQSGMLRFRWCRGGAFVGLGSVGGLALRYDDWYSLSVTVGVPDPDGRVILTASLAGLTRPAVSASLAVATYRYLPENGRFGVGADCSLVDFASFTVGDSP